MQGLDPPTWEITILVFSILLALGLLLGELSLRLHLPRVTGYIIAGILAGPLVGVVSSFFEGTELQVLLDTFLKNALALSFIKELALSIIMFILGGGFALDQFKGIGRRIVYLSLFEALGTFFIVFFFLYLVSGDLLLTCFLSILSIQTAPAATYYVLRDLESEGSLSQKVLALTGLNNFYVLLLFPLATSFFLGFPSPGVGLSISLVGSVLFGILGGFLLSFLEVETFSEKESVVFVLASIALFIGLGHYFEALPLLSAFLMGITNVNVNPKSAATFQAVEKLAIPLLVLFFILSGMHLKFETLVSVGTVGLLFILLRAGGKFLSIRLGLYFFFPHPENRPLAYSLFCQAGLALGFAFWLQRESPDVGDEVVMIILGSVLVFELFGPVLLRHSLIKGGEVKLVSLIPGLERRTTKNIIDMANRLAHRFGLHHWKVGKDEKGFRAKHIMRGTGDGLQEATTFKEILRFVGKSPYDIFPVVDKGSMFVGNITVADIRDVFVKDVFSVETEGRVVIARDLISSTTLRLTPEMSLREAFDVFHKSNDEIGSLPVIDDKTGKLLGMVKQSDLFDALHMESSTGES